MNNFFRQARHFFPAYIVLFTGLLLTIVAAAYVYFSSYERERLRFESSINDTSTKVTTTMQTYIALLRAGAGLFNVENNIVSEEEFREFVSKLNLPERYPGVLGVGFSRRNGSAHEVVYIEPLDARNKITLGYNMFSEVSRRSAMIKSAESATSAMSGKVVLLQEIDQNKQAGFLVFYPLYDTDDIASLSAEERLDHLIGFIYGPFRAGDFMENVFTSQTDQVAISVYDEVRNPINLLYDSSVDKPDQQKHKSRFVATTTLALPGRSWIVEFRSLPALEAHSGIEFAPAILFLGSAINFTLFLLVRSGLKLREERSEILERIADGFISVDNDGRIAYINREAAYIFDTTPGRLIGKRFSEVLPKRAKSKLTFALQKSVREKKTNRFEWYYKTTDSWYGMRFYPSESGTSIFILDITKRKNLERQKDEFLGLASHELKTPITSLKAYAQVLHSQFSKTKDSESAGHLLKMIDQINRLTRLVIELLDVSRIQAGKLQFNETTFEFSELITETAEEMQRTTNSHKIIINKNSKVKITADRERLGQVLVNLMSNAIKYSPNANKIIVSSTKERKNIKVTVEDFGIGIPKEKQRKIFKRFYRVENETSFAGLGLGLYIVAQVIRRHNGKIWIKSKKNGSVFCFTLPLLV